MLGDNPSPNTAIGFFMVAPQTPHSLFETEVELDRQVYCPRSNDTVSCDLKLMEISDIKGMSLTWSDAILRARPSRLGLTFDVLGDCVTSLAGSAYDLRNVRLLGPSAHRIRRHFSPLEIQFIHQSASGNRLTLAALFCEGEPNQEVEVALTSLLFRQSSIRLIDLIPLGRTFYVHRASNPALLPTRRDLHLISVEELKISPAQLLKLRTW